MVKHNPDLYLNEVFIEPQINCGYKRLYCSSFTSFRAIHFRLCHFFRLYGNSAGAQEFAVSQWRSGNGQAKFV